MGISVDLDLDTTAEGRIDIQGYLYAYQTGFFIKAQVRSANNRKLSSSPALPLLPPCSFSSFTVNLSSLHLFQDTQAYSQPIFTSGSPTGLAIR